MFRFTIRGVLWLVLAVALSLSWLSGRGSMSRRLDAVKDERDKFEFSSKAWESDAKRLKSQLPHNYNPLDGSIVD